MKIKISSKEYIKYIKDYNFPGVENGKYGKYFYISNLINTVNIAIAVSLFMFLIFCILFLLMNGNVIGQEFFDDVKVKLFISMPISFGVILLLFHIMALPLFARYKNVYKELDEVISSKNVPTHQLLIKGEKLFLARFKLNKTRYNYLMHELKKYNIKKIRKANKAHWNNFGIIQTNRELIPFPYRNEKQYDAIKDKIEEWCTDE